MFFVKKSNRKPLLTFSALCVVGVAAAELKTYHVDGAFQGEAPTGDSWRSAFPDLTTAITNATANGGGEIWVKSGVYKPEIGGRANTIELSPNLKIYGGFRGVETNRLDRNPKANRTVLSGDLGRVGSVSDNSYHVITAAENCRIDGFIISRGNANSAAEHRLGGGLLIPPGAANVVAANCVFEKNNAEIGGAIMVDAAELTVTNCTFYSNSGDSGGAIATSGKTKLTIQNSIFSSNYAPKQGGAVSIAPGAEARIAGASFLYNSTDGHGGAIVARVERADQGLSLEMLDCEISENSARENGGGAAFIGPFTPVLNGCSFEKNFSARGAGAIANAKGATTVLLSTSFAKNRGTKGSENIGSDSLSRVVESREEGEKIAREAAKKFQELENPKPVVVEAPVVVEIIKRQLPDVYVYNARGLKIKLRGVVSEGACSVLVFGDLTDPRFIENYRDVEALARDYAPLGARFSYIHGYLKHPENNGFLQPYHLKERARQTQLAAENLATSIPWLHDAMDNQTAKALAPKQINDVFVFSADGTEIHAGEISDIEALRNALAEAVGQAPTTTPLDVIPTASIEPVNMMEANYAPRVTVNAKTEKFEPLQLTPMESRAPHYVKVRVEANTEMLETGDGKLYLGFHIDPLYQVEWNNLGEPLNYQLKTRQGVVAPSINSAQRVTATATDAEPREFLLQGRKLDLNQPLALQVNYSVHSIASKKNIEVSQQYIIYLDRDEYAGKVMGRQETAEKRPAQKAADSGSAFAAMLSRFDLDRNGKLTNDEVIGRLRSGFDEIDANKDGAINAAEYAEYRNSR